MKFRRLLPVLLVAILLYVICFAPAAYAPYRDYDPLLTSFMTLANNYPSLVTYEAVGKTVLNEDIIMFRIGNPAGGRVLFDGGMHGPETIGGELLYLYAEWLLTSNDPLANRILKGDYTLLIPALNVDSYNRARKNANGVDLNRNFATNWEHSGSTDPSSDSYRGTGPLSEPESQRLVDVFQDYAPSFYVNLHMWDGPYYAGSVYGNKTYYSSIVSKISSLSGNRGVTPFPYYGELGGAGYAISDAARAGATSFLIELIKQVIPFSEIETTTLPRFIPVAAVLSQECESTVFFEDGFESGGFGAWNGTYATSGESAAVVNTASYRGLHSAMFKSNGNGGTEKAYCYKNVAPSSEFCALGSFMVASSGIKENDDRFYLIMLSANENGVVKTGWRNVNGVTRWTLIMRDGTGWVTAYSDWSPSLNQWYNVALHWVSDPMNGRSELLINGLLACSFENKNTTAFGNIDQARFGLPELYYCDMTTAYFDYCKLSKTAVASFPPWDLNQDGTTNILDLVTVAKAIGSVIGSPNWDPLADLNGDKTVNILDMAAVASHLEK